MPRDWLDPTLFEGSDPFSATLDAFAEKMAATSDPFGGKFLNSWLTERGGGHLFTFDGNKPVDFEPSFESTPAVMIWTDLGEGFEPRGEGDRRLSIGWFFEGWIYTLDQREMLAFLWRSLAAVGFPWMDPIDPVARVPFMQNYYLSGPVGGRPFQVDEGDVCVWRFKVVTEFAGANLPFFRGL